MHEALRRHRWLLLGCFSKGDALPLVRSAASHEQMETMKNTYPFPCPEWADALAALHPDDLSAVQQMELEAHLATCPACSQVRAGYRAMASRIERLPSVRPLAELPEQFMREWAAYESIPTKPGPVPERAALERALHLVPARPRPATQVAREEGAAAPVMTLVAPPEEDSKDPDDARLRLADREKPALAEAYVGLSQLAGREVTGLAGLPERLPKAMAVLPPLFSFARPARDTASWQTLVACFVIVPLLLVIMPLSVLQRLGDTASGSTLDAYIQPLSFAQKCTGLLGLPEVAMTLDNSRDDQPLDWHISILDTDPSGSLPWAKASEMSGMVPAGARSTFTLIPLGVLCEIMQGAPAPIEYHIIFYSQGQRTTITDRVTPP